MQKKTSSILIVGEKPSEYNHVPRSGFPRPFLPNAVLILLIEEGQRVNWPGKVNALGLSTGSVLTIKAGP